MVVKDCMHVSLLVEGGAARRPPPAAAVHARARARARARAHALVGEAARVSKGFIFERGCGQQEPLRQLGALLLPGIIGTCTNPHTRKMTCRHACTSTNEALLRNNRPAQNLRFPVAGATTPCRLNKS